MELCPSPQQTLCNADILITTTASTKPLVSFDPEIRTKLVVCVGADEVGKQEVDVSLIEKAGLVVVDNLEQARRVGELQHLHDRDIATIILGCSYANNTKTHTLVDLTGVAVQDIQVAKEFFE